MNENGKVSADIIIKKFRAMQSGLLGTNPSPAPLFEMIESDSELYNDNSVQEAVVLFMARVAQKSYRFLKSAPHFLHNQSFRDTVAKMLKDPESVEPSFGGPSFGGLLDAVMPLDSLRVDDKVQEAIAHCIENMAKHESEFGINSLTFSHKSAEYLSRIMYYDDLTSNPRIIKALGNAIGIWQHFDSLIDRFYHDAKGQELIRNSIIQQVIVDRIVTDDSFQFSSRAFDSNTFATTFARMIRQEKEPSALINRLWPFSNITSTNEFQEAVESSVQRIADAIRASQNEPHIIIERIVNVKRLIQNRIIREAIISRAEFFVEQIVVEGSPGPELSDENLGRVQNLLFDLPFLIESDEFKQASSEMSGFKEIADDIRKYGLEW
ncbi:MAG: hypothetical protein ACW975_04405 [Candidatus Thorarchaeota archaeon]|jgi:hypothetical protein